MDEINQDKPSKSQLKRDAENLQELGSALVKLPHSVLDKFPLPEDLLEAIKLAKSIRQNGALKRQLQFIGKLMRNHDTNKIKEMYDNYHLKIRQKNNNFHIYEDWRDKFLSNDESVFNDFITECPDVDRQHLRQLQRLSINEIKQQKAPKNSRLLFKFIKESIDQKNNKQD
ncbi:MAG: ribosome biogenesis factor YjgA [Gammaproteobacteria bacterium]